METFTMFQELLGLGNPYIKSFQVLIPSIYLTNTTDAMENLVCLSKYATNICWCLCFAMLKWIYKFFAAIKTWGEGLITSLGCRDRNMCLVLMRRAERKRAE
jgi:hypothetical protein